MSSSTDPTSEDLLADALAAFDAGGETALQAFVSAHPEQASVLQRGIARCRQMGLLSAPSSRSFPERLDEYRLLRKIGGGGMGVVYEAEHEKLGQHVALKLIRPELLYFEGARERFRREVDAIAKLAHPAIVRVLSSGEQDGLPYFAMELLPGATGEQVLHALSSRAPSELEGADLRAVVNRERSEGTGELFEGPWWKCVARLGVQVALGLRHAHLRGIVHRDLKPSNVMITPHGQAVVLDFGVAQTKAAQELTRSGATPGSPAFMSPEQVRGEATDERTDIYSLGATLWNLLALERPFTGPKVLDLIQQGQLRSLRARNANLPRELELVLRKALDRDRERRYGDMAELAEDLQAVLARRPIAARPVPLALRAWRWCQRHRVAATALAGALVLALLLPAALAWQQSEANAALRAEQARTAEVNRALTAAEARTNESLETALDALHGVLVRLGNEKLQRVPLAEQLAQQTLEDAAQLFRALLERHPEHQRVRLQGGRALHALAMSYDRQGKSAEAIATLEEALAVLDDPRCAPNGALLDVRACTRMSLASALVDQRDRAAALAAVEAAERDFLASAAASTANHASALRGRANLRTTLSILIDEQREPERAERALREGLALLEEAIAHGPADAKDAGLELTMLGNLGKFLERQRRDDEARQVLADALEKARALGATPGSLAPPEQMIAELEEALGNVLGRRGDPRAEELLRGSLEARERLVAAYPERPLLRIQLAGSIHNLANLVGRREGGTEEALALFERAREVQEQALAEAPGNAQGLAYLTLHLKMIGSCQVKLRRGERLLETARALAALERAERDAPYRAALFFLHARRLLAQQPELLRGTDCVEAALDQLLRAAEHGYRDAAELEHAFFAPLRAHPRYEELRAKIAGG
ncbi:MAG: protein kinase [Planctomycetes bacterium]|nr:protein kinase [Planctomycetota bacterium]